MRGLLMDANLAGHLAYLLRHLKQLDLLPVLEAEGVEWVTHRLLGIPASLDDRQLWNYCQDHGWVLFTENRNRFGEDSLEATIRECWQVGHLPVLTLGKKNRFESNHEYAELVAADLADFLFGLKHGEFRDRPRIYVPRKAKPEEHRG